MPMKALPLGLDLPPTSRNAMRGVLRAVSPATYQTAHRYSIVVSGAHGEAPGAVAAQDGYRCHWARLDGWEGEPVALFPEAWLPEEDRLVKLSTLLNANKRAELRLAFEDDCQCHAVLHKHEVGEHDEALVKLWEPEQAMRAYRESVTFAGGLADMIPKGYDASVTEMIDATKGAEEFFRLPGGKVRTRYLVEALRAALTPSVNVGFTTLGKSTVFALRGYDSDGLLTRAIIMGITKAAQPPERN